MTVLSDDRAGDRAADPADNRAGDRAADRAEHRASEGSRAPSAGPSGMGRAIGAVVGIVAIGTVLTMLGVVAVAVVALLQGGGSEPAAAAPTAIEVSLTEFGIDGQLTVPAGDVVLTVVNDGAIDHNLAVPSLGVQSRNLAAGATETIALDDLAPGTYEIICTIPGHEASGMKAELVVTDGESAGDTAGTSAGVTGAGAMDHGAMGHGMSAEEAQAMDMAMVESMLAFPAETEGRGNQILEPEVLADGTKKFTLVAEVVPWEVAPGQIVDAWAYNGQVPGPQIRLDLGDRVQVELTNLTPVATDIHFHGIHTPNNQDGVSPYTQDPIANGETFTYEFVADKPAIGMYHAHMHGQTSVVNGMFAVFTIGENPLPRGETVAGVTIPADLEPVFEEPMVVNDAGTIGLSLNGKSFPATEPFVMNEGDWGVIHYYNEGLTAHPMHLHKFPQLVYAKDGIPLDEPYWADTINVAPGERYSVLFQADAAGTWVFHCHILTHVEREEGMFGMATAIVVNET